VAEWLRSGLQNRLPRFNSGRRLQQNQTLSGISQTALINRPLAGPDWLHEIKHDGYRLIVRRDGAAFRPPRP
jgi:hypothetical protein